MDYYRTARFQRQRNRKYVSSTSERLLESLCLSFGTQLLPAEITIGGSSSYLTRLSNPVIVTDPENRQRLLQFQQTRFSPLSSHRFTEVYNKNRERRKQRPLSDVLKVIESQHDPWDTVKEITDEHYIEGLNMHRWPKVLYFAVFDLWEFINPEGKFQPFFIHEVDRLHRSIGTLQRQLPSVHVKLEIEPIFVIGQHREDDEKLYDSLLFTFPEAQQRHVGSLNKAQSLHPTDRLKYPENAFKERSSDFFARYDIHSTVPRTLTMGLIAAYLRKLCLGKDFY